MMIVIAIIAILATLAAAPYNYFSDKQRVRTQVARFEQLVSQAKSEASNGFLFKAWGGIEETASTAIEINPNGGMVAPTINYIRYRPSSPNVYMSCSASSASCSIFPVTLVDQKIRIKQIDWVNVTSTSSWYIFFEAPNGSGSQTLSWWISQSDVKLLIQLGEDPTLTKTVTLSSR